jgi:hypothetical protein
MSMLTTLLNSFNSTSVEQKAFNKDLGYLYNNFVNHKSVALSDRVELLSQCMEVDPIYFSCIIEASKSINPVQVYIKYKEGHELDKSIYGIGATGDCLHYIGFLKNVNGQISFSEYLNVTNSKRLVLSNIESVEYIN